MNLSRKTEAISEIKVRAIQDHMCPYCGDERRRKWGLTRTKVQRYRCTGCQKTYSGRTGSAIGRPHHPDLFLAALQDMQGVPIADVCYISITAVQRPRGRSLRT